MASVRGAGTAGKLLEPGVEAGGAMHLNRERFFRVGEDEERRRD